MIYIKNENSFEKLESWDELLQREGFQKVVDLSGKTLSDAFGYYELPNKVPCGKKNCRTNHFKGVLVVTEDGVETNIGHDCGFAAFGLKFDQLATELTKQANYHRLLIAVKKAKSEIFSWYKKKAKLESGKPSLNELAHKLLDAKDPNVIGRAAYDSLKKMAGSNNGKVIISRRKTDTEIDIAEVMSQKTSSRGDELLPKKPRYEDVLIGNVLNADCLLNDYDVSILFERDVRGVLEELSAADPDSMHQRKLTRLGVRVSRLEERISFISDRIYRARIFLTQENLQPLFAKINAQRNVSQKDKNLFSNFIDSLPDRADSQG